MKMENLHDSGLLRAQPRQARSRETFDKLLAAAGDMLVETGWEGFNTNALAERVGCRVATVYRYFPDKVAIVSTLAEKIIAQWDKELLDLAESVNPGMDFRELWPLLVDRFIGILKRQPAAMAVRNAMQAEPTLRAMDQADNKRLAESVGRLL
ncbi:MAG: TetR/AcrR family transcriptional regulator, partial [Pseudomonadota bacterium]